MSSSRIVAVVAVAAKVRTLSAVVELAMSRLSTIVLAAMLLMQVFARMKNNQPRFARQVNATAYHSAWRLRRWWRRGRDGSCARSMRTAVQILNEFGIPVRDARCGGDAAAGPPTELGTASDSAGDSWPE